jgi:hypothetical protein
MTTVLGWISSIHPRMNKPTLFAASVLLLALAACSSSTTGSGSGTGTGTGATAGTSGGTGTGAGTGGAGTCDAACTKYLQCKALDAQNQSACVQACHDQGYTSDQLAQIEQADCAAVVAYVDGNKAPPSGGAKDCYGCQSDGSSCVYVAGAYASACDPSCC